MLLDDFAIYIPTRGRAEKQGTIANLPKQLRKKTYLIVDKNEYQQHRQYASKVKKILRFPPNWGKYIYDDFGCVSDKKEWLAERTDKRYFFLFDDDLSFSSRKKGRLLKATDKDVLESFKILYSWMKDDGIPHVGFSCRSGNNRVETDYVDNSRCIMSVGFDLKIIRKEKIKMNRLPIRSDFDTTLQLLEAGYNNRVLYTCAQGHPSSNTKGGCSIYRTEKMMTQNALDLEHLHKGIVSISQKKTKHAWSGFDSNVRTDVTIGWKKAYQQGLAKRSNKGKLDFLS